MTDDNFFIQNILRITCADAVELMTEYLEEALNTNDLDHFEQHVSLCEGCQVYMDQLRSTIALTSMTGATTVELEPVNMGELFVALDEQTASEAHF